MRTLGALTDGPAHQEDQKKLYLQDHNPQLLLQNRIQIPPTMEMIMILGIIGIDLLDIMVAEVDFQREVMEMMIMVIDLQDMVVMVVVVDLQMTPEIMVMMIATPRTLMISLITHTGRLMEYIIVLDLHTLMPG